MKLATIYLRESNFFIHALSRTRVGVWIFSQPCVKLEATCSNSDLGAAVRKALDSSRNDVPHPEREEILGGQLYELAGVKNWRMFMKNSTCVIVEEEGGKVSIVPQSNLGKEGFQPITSETTTIGSASVELVGERVRSAAEHERNSLH